MAKASDNVFPKVQFLEGSAPSTPSSGQVRLYSKTDGLLYSKDDAGTETLVSGGSSSSDDTIPAGGTLYSGSSTSGWTAYGSGGLTTFDANTTVPGALYIAKSSPGNNLYGIERNLEGAMPRTITCRVKSGLVYTNYHGFGLSFHDSTPSASQSWGFTHDSGATGVRIMQRTAWSNLTTAGASTNYTEATNPGIMPHVPLWIRLTLTSSTSVAYAMSMDGYQYFTFASGINPGFTIAKYGVFIFGFGVDMAASFDWIHST